ncbi:MAG: response regulator transcription factor [Aquificae bacterium]|nr:response regulator transcription factor [Aquificota bacterium]
MSEKILIVEDDKLLANSLKEYLEANGFRVELAYTYEEALEKLEKGGYTAYVIDVNLTDGSGIKLIEYLKLYDDQTPALIISALTDTATIAEGFSAGAEDYVKKPFDPEELLIRLKARLKTDNLTYKHITYRDGRFFSNDKEIELGEVERCVLLKLLRNRGKVVSKDSLLSCMKNPSPTGLRVIINTLKKKTNLNIKAVKGLGYVVD